MANFDDNPFADPFAEPPVAPQQHNAAQHPQQQQQLIDDFSPFGEPPSANNVTGNITPQYNQSSGIPSSPASSQLGSNNPPPYSSTGEQQITTEEFRRRQEELEKKAQELAKREEELRAAGALGGVRYDARTVTLLYNFENMKSSESGPLLEGGSHELYDSELNSAINFDRKDLSTPLAVTIDDIARQNNWPPLPSFFPIGPCFYQDINVDIPLEFQKIVRLLYYIWMFNTLLLLVNILGSFGYWIAGLDNGAQFGLSIVYFLMFTPFSYICWFRPLYKAFRNDSSFNFMVFFFVFFFQIVVAVFSAVGFVGVCGWIPVGSSFSNGCIFLGIFLALLALSSSALAGSMIVCIVLVHRIYRSTGASFSKAQAEFAQGVIRNEHVQAAAASAASAAVRNQFTAGPQSPGSASTASVGPRF